MVNQVSTKSIGFKIFLVFDIVLTMLLIALGRYIFPFIAWLIDGSRTVEVLLIVLTSVSGALLIAWVILLFVSRRKARKNMRDEKLGLPYPMLFVLALSLSSINAVNLPINICTQPYATRWGGCMVSDYSILNFFGVRKFHVYEELEELEEQLNEVDENFVGIGDGNIYKVRNDEGNKMIMIVYHAIFDDGSDWFHYEGVEVDCRSLRHEVHAMMFNSAGDYLYELEPEYYWYYWLPKSERENLESRFGLKNTAVYYEDEFMSMWEPKSSIEKRYVAQKKGEGFRFVK